jgi:hypothetical protein
MFFMMSGESLEDYFRRLNLDETRRQYLENIKEGNQVDRDIEEQFFKNGNREQHSVITEHRYFVYMRRFGNNRHHIYPPLSNYT